MGRRKAISKKIRFEVFKRDSFTCQYCGRSAPDVVLNDEQQINEADELISALVPGYSLNDNGRSTIKRLVGKFGLGEVLECIRISARQYIVIDEYGKAKEETAQKTFTYIEKIAENRWMGEIPRPS